MTRFKDFGSGNTGEAKEPLSFQIYDQTFNCIPEVQGKLMLDLSGDLASEDPGATARLIDKFFGQILTDESWERFSALLTDKTKIVSVETITEVISWLIEEYTGRPNQQPEGSLTGQ
jgi:hypothetical protein